MKKLYYATVLVAVLGLIVLSCEKTLNPVEVLPSEQSKLGAMVKGSNGTTIQEGVLTYSTGHYLDGQSLTVGFDIFGYNYQAHLFRGYYANVYLGGYGFPPYEDDDDAYLEKNPEAEDTWYWPYRHTNLIMKWNDAWLSNKDCDGDGKLDRHYGYDSYIGSGAWETNHQWGDYVADGETCNWNYFVKIVAVPEDASLDTLGIDTWYTANGTEIGPSIWGAFAVIQRVYNDPCGGYHGVEYLSPAGPGFGKY